MKLIIAGGRDYEFSGHDYAALDSLHAKFGFTEIVSGGCTGADKCGERWAALNEIPVKQFNADWSQGRCAGPIRNQKMAAYANACICFPGGAGTDSMADIARDVYINSDVFMFWDFRGAE